MEAIWYFAITVFTAGFALAVCTIFPARAQGNALTKAMEGIARQPEAANSIQGTLIIGLAFIEALCIYGLVVALILLFVNPFTKSVMEIAEKFVK